MEVSDTEGELGGGRGIVRVDGGDETSPTSVCERCGIVQTVVAHDGADRAEGLDLMDVGRSSGIGAVQENRRNERASRRVGVDGTEVVEVADDEFRFGSKLLQIG